MGWGLHPRADEADAAAADGVVRARFAARFAAGSAAESVAVSAMSFFLVASD